MQPSSILLLTTLALGAAYSLYLAVIMVIVANPLEGGVPTWVGLLLAFAWAASPAASLAYRALTFGPNALVGSLCVLGILFIGGPAIPVYHTAFFGETIDAQAGLVFLFIPLYQWVAVGLLQHTMSRLVKRNDA